VRVLVVGASGFIGSGIVARLRAEGHDTVAIVHSPAKQGGQVYAIELANTTVEVWSAHLTEVDVVINCAGVLQDSPRDSTKAAHVTGPATLFAACEKSGVRRVIHFSAVGVDNPLSAFSKTKLKAEQALRQTGLDWVILRPSVVVGSAAYGGSALFRGLAALPVLPRVKGAGQLQIVQLDDVVDTVVRLIQPDAPSKMILDVVGPERLSMWDVVAAYRKWLGCRPQPILDVPTTLSNVLYRLGDFAGLLGWRPPMRSTARSEIVRGAIGDPKPWSELMSRSPRKLWDALQAEPASVQERWFARLYFLKPVVFGVLSLFWIATGLISLGPGWEIGLETLRRGGVVDLAPLAITAGALADIVIGAGIAFKRTAWLALWAGILLSLVYAVVGTIILPSLWADPLGPMLKIWPIIVLLFVALAIRYDR
jgi:uncharacterized protein YbjT (DUF2867 family)